MRTRSISFLMLLLAAGLVAAIGLPSQATAQAPDPLTLTITAERSECTAGTLNPVSWTIAGGTAPYTLTVAGQSVDPTAESVNVTCGALLRGASEAPATISAVVTDAAGSHAEASAAYTIVPPLPAPTGLEYYGVLSFEVTLEWDAVDGAGSQSPVVQNDRGRRGFDSYLFRYRDADAEATAPYEFVGPLRRPVTQVRPGPLDAEGKPTTTGDYLGMVAAIRHTIEQETPAALQWSAPVQFGLARAPENIVARATHDTLDVSWDVQPYTQTAVVELVGGGLNQSRCCVGSGITIADGRHHALFHHLTPDSEYEITIRVGDGVDAGVFVSETTARTSAAPADWEPLPSGPQNLRVTTTHDSIIVRWDPPFPAPDHSWSVGVTTTVNGITWPVQSLVTRTPPPEGWTLRGLFRPIRPNTTYSVRVAQNYRASRAVEVSVTTPAAPAPLTMALTAERSECTAGTVNPVSWEISGGTPPYTLTVAGQSVDPAAESVNVACGALPEGASEAPGTITASVTDADGDQWPASAAYTIVPPLPAPTNLSARGLRTYAVADWDSVSAADGPVHYILRWKRTAASDWTYEHEFDFLEYAQGARRGWYSPRLPEGTAFEIAVAVMRNPIERQTPEALTWSAPVSFATVTNPKNVVVTSTHDTITVTWDVGAGPLGLVWVSSAEGGKDPKTKTIADGQARAEFTGLLPNTDYTIRIVTLESEDLTQGAGAWAQVRTKPAPPDWVPLPTGPKNLRVTATHDTITATWDPPHADADSSYGTELRDVATGFWIRPWVTIKGTEFTVENLQPGRSYEVHVTHYGATIAAETRTVTTMPAPTSPLTCFEYLVGAVICTWATDAPRLR